MDGFRTTEGFARLALRRRKVATSAAASDPVYSVTAPPPSFRKMDGYPGGGGRGAMEGPDPVWIPGCMA